MQTEANGRRAHAAHSLSCWNGIILLIQDCSHTAARNCNKMVSLIMEEEMEKHFFFFFCHFAWLQSLKEEYNVEKNVNHVNSLSRRSGICMAVPVMRHGAPSGLFDETYQAFVFLTEFSALKTLLFSILQNSKWRFSVLSTPSPQLDPGVSEALQT